MKRKEEIEKAAREYEASPVDWSNEDIEIRDFFKRGAEWADENPRKGLWDSEEVCKFLQDRIAHTSIAYLMTTKYLIEDLKKTMEKVI